MRNEQPPSLRLQPILDDANRGAQSGFDSAVVSLLLAVCFSVGHAEPAHAARLERFRASVHPATGEVFSCRSNTDLLCAYKQCIRSHPEAADETAGWPCQKLSVADVGDGTDPVCTVGLYRLAADAAEVFGAVACGASRAEAEEAARAWGRENGKAITRLSTVAETLVSEPDEPEDVPTPKPPTAAPPYLVIFAEVTNGQRGGGAWAFCTSTSLAEARECAETKCSRSKQYSACVETGYGGRGGACAVARAKGFGISWGSCAESPADASDSALADCRRQAARYYPGDQALCEISWEQKI